MLKPNIITTTKGKGSIWNSLNYDLYDYFDYRDYFSYRIIEIIKNQSSDKNIKKIISLQNQK